MAEATNMKKAGTGKSALGLVMLAIGVIIMIALAIWVLMNPAVLAATLTLILFIVGAIIVIGLIILGIMFILAIPMYAAKGEQYQDGVDYSINDVKPVKESSSEDKKNE
jgi:formate/nitrite transporter FocA (FNT family)